VLYVDVFYCQSPTQLLSFILLFSYLILLFSYSLILLFSYSLILLFSYSPILCHMLLICSYARMLTVLDPTNAQGQVELTLSYVTMKVSTTMTRINEPPQGKGVDVNCVTRVAGSVVTFAAERDIVAGGECQLYVLCFYVCMFVFCMLYSVFCILSGYSHILIFPHSPILFPYFRGALHRLRRRLRPQQVRVRIR
jgi:hypothetical protein